MNNLVGWLGGWLVGLEAGQIASQCFQLFSVFQWFYFLLRSPWQVTGEQERMNTFGHKTDTSDHILSNTDYA